MNRDFLSMHRTRLDSEALEDRELAAYGMRSSASRGRAHPSTLDLHRTAFQRDRDRIVHSRAFRRLQYKTQVFTNDEGDHFRTRLTHTLEVSQLAEVAARRLGLNEDLVECIALVHDIGHPPFGHRGEDLLSGLMTDHGGFEHNGHGLRIVEELEMRYPEFPGLNLSYEVREAIVKHAAHDDPDLVPVRFHPEESPLLEAQLVDAVDSIVYDCHDIDDGLRGGYLTLEGLDDVPLWRGAWREAVEGSPRGASSKLVMDRTLRVLMERLIDDLVEHIDRRISEQGITSVAKVRAARESIAVLTPSMQVAKSELERWLFTHLYRHHLVNRTFHTAQRILSDLFGFFTEHPDSLPPEFAARTESMGLHRVVADYIAGMTDRFALDEHAKLFASEFRRN